MTTTSRKERFGTRDGRMSARWNWRHLVFVFFAVAVCASSFALSGIQGEKTASLIYSNEGLMRAAARWIPDNLEIRYRGEIVHNREMTIPDPAYSGGSMSYTSSPNAEISLKFTGGKVEWAGYTGPHGGIVQVLVDGKPVSTVDLFAFESEIKPLFVTPDFAPGEHVLVLRALEERNANSQGNAIHLDYFDIRQGERTARIENEDREHVRYDHANDYYYYPFLLRKLAHFLLFAGMTASLMIIASWTGIRRRWLGCIPVALGLWAIADEAHQWFVPDRHPSWFDVGVDMVGVASGLAVFALINRLAKRRKS
ncbi:VanZ family protein [Cohnella cholangitidis]|uniref:VanZ family protein n=1 Tax=Cohnella cholangitidis TaxID=2598458 RepID=A0A7G5BWP2_9BACL|nr:VanZ family protein [Cohnella cholangitidis]QMV41376.1 VanZ family protein [Cohnella cholangitidis]